jgi:hypothetical protein
MELGSGSSNPVCDEELTHVFSSAGCDYVLEYIDRASVSIIVLIASLNKEYFNIID